MQRQRALPLRTCRYQPERRLGRALCGVRLPHLNRGPPPQLVGFVPLGLGEYPPPTIAPSRLSPHALERMRTEVSVLLVSVQTVTRGSGTRNHTRSDSAIDWGFTAVLVSSPRSIRRSRASPRRVRLEHPRGGG